VIWRNRAAPPGGDRFKLAALDRKKLSSSATLASGTFWNLLGRGGPMLAALIITPPLIHILGVARWGVLSTALALVGMFGFFDFGIGRALTRLLAEMIGAGEEDKAASLVKTGIIVLAGIGFITGAIALLLVNIWSYDVMAVPGSMQREVRTSLYILCSSIPLVTLTGALWGVISAYQKFRIANLFNFPILSFYYIGPLIAAYLTNSLVWVMVSLVLCRVAIIIVYVFICLDTMPSLRDGVFDPRKIPSLLRIGGWMTVSNITFPVLQYCDRLVLISVLSATAAGYYSTPADLVARFFIVVGSVMTSAFPAIASCYKADPENAVRLFRRSVLMVILWLAGPCLVGCTFSHELLAWWIGPAYADHAAIVFRLLCFGVMLGGADQVVATLLDSIGRPAINAKFSIVEIFIYIPVLAILLYCFGIEGGAIAWILRAGIDFLFRLWLACRLFPVLLAAVPDVVKTLAFATLAMLLPSLGSDGPARLGLAMLSLAAILCFVWLFTLSEDEKSFATQKAQRLVGAIAQRAS
jgi:O-antigen/teichoic acid export membrane protein